MLTWIYLKCIAWSLCYLTSPDECAGNTFHHRIDHYWSFPKALGMVYFLVVESTAALWCDPAQWLIASSQLLWWGDVGDSNLWVISCLKDCYVSSILNHWLLASWVQPVYQLKPSVLRASSVSVIACVVGAALLRAETVLLYSRFSLCVSNKKWYVKPCKLKLC